MSPTPDQLKKTEAFKALHEAPGTFIIPNAWDAGSARILTSLGFAAIAGSSAGIAFSQGKPDGAGLLRLEDVLQNACDIVQATHLPVAADLENGYGDTPDACARTILQAAAAGLVGGSIEDATGNPAQPVYDFDTAVARMQAAVEAARSLGFPFLLAGRAENYLHDRPDLDDTIRRLVAYAEAGADILFAPGLRTAAEISAVVKAVAPKPVNVLVNALTPPLPELQTLGVKRISLGSTLARVAYTGLLHAGKEIMDRGSFNFISNAITYANLNEMMRS